MNNSIRILLVASTLSIGTAVIAAKTGHELEPGPTLSIRLYNAAHVKPQILDWARAETIRIFKAGGINATWELPAVEAADDRGIDMSANSSNTDSRRNRWSESSQARRQVLLREHWALPYPLHKRELMRRSFTPGLRS